MGHDQDTLKEMDFHFHNFTIFVSLIGPDLPKKLYGHAVYPYENDIYVLGGNSGFWYEKAIHRLSCSNAECLWTTMKATLKVRRQYFVPIPMNTSQVTCISLLPEDD